MVDTTRGPRGQQPKEGRRRTGWWVAVATFSIVLAVGAFVLFGGRGPDVATPVPTTTTRLPSTTAPTTTTVSSTTTTQPTTSTTVDEAAATAALALAEAQVQEWDGGDYETYLGRFRDHTVPVTVCLNFSCTNPFELTLADYAITIAYEFGAERLPGEEECDVIPIGEAPDAVAAALESLDDRSGAVIVRCNTVATTYLSRVVADGDEETTRLTLLVVGEKLAAAHIEASTGGIPSHAEDQFAHWMDDNYPDLPLEARCCDPALSPEEHFQAGRERIRLIDLWLDDLAANECAWDEVQCGG